MSENYRIVSCPKPGCWQVLYEDDDFDGDGFVTCACGASVDFDAAYKLAQASQDGQPQAKEIKC